MNQEQTDRLDALKSMAAISRCYHDSSRETLKGHGLCKTCKEAREEVSWEIEAIENLAALVEWTDKTEEDINLTEVFILADRIHQWIAANQSHTEFNYLSLVCVSGQRTDEKWAASFDSMACDCEWYESIEKYPLSARGACPEEAVFKAASKAREAIKKIESKNFR